MAEPDRREREDIDVHSELGPARIGEKRDREHEGEEEGKSGDQEAAAHLRRLLAPRRDRCLLLLLG